MTTLGSAATEPAHADLDDRNDEAIGATSAQLVRAPDDATVPDAIVPQRTAGRRLRLAAVTGGAPAMPLVVLFGLNAVDELDRTAFGVLSPNIRDHFGLSNQGILTLITAFSLVVILLSIPIAHQADRRNRVGMARGGATMWAGFSVLTGVAPAVGVLVLARIGSGLGKAVNEPTHNSLLADYYPDDARARVYYVHRFANSVGQLLGPVTAGLLATWFTWRTPFVVFAGPTVVFILLSFKLREPKRGIQDRISAGADEAGRDIEDDPLPFKEAWSVLWNVRSLRRVFFALPFLSASLIGLAALLNLFWEEVYGYNAAQRGVLESVSEAFQMVGLVVGAVVVQRVLSKSPRFVIRLLAMVSVAAGGAIALMALSPSAIGSIAGRIVFAVLAVSLIPGIYSVGSMAIPARTRSLGFSAAGVFAIPGIVFLPIAGGIGDAYGLRAGILILIPVYLLGALILASAGRFVDDDIARTQADALAAVERHRATRAPTTLGAAAAPRADSNTDTATGATGTNGRARRAKPLTAKRRTTTPSSAATALGSRPEAEPGPGDPSTTLLSIRNLDVAYDQTQVLFDVNLDVAEGEIVALLGTNGAGKSTVLKAVSGLLPVRRGSVYFDGANLTSRDARSTAMWGIAQVPGGRGVFPSLTVAENLRAASWMFKGDKSRVAAARARSLELFPRLAERMDTPAGALSGGEQQMLSLSQAFIAQPRLLMIDELSLGLAPTIVDRLLDIVGEIHRDGTTIILVEQSVNTALRLAERAVFLEKGEVRFEGPTEDLLERSDILRSVYLKGVSVGGRGPVAAEAEPSPESAGLARPAPADVLDAPVVLRVDGMTKTYGGISAVNDVGFALHHGQILGLIGPNGAGKTTVLDMISGFTKADSGLVRLDGEDISGWPAYARARAGLGRMFQDARLFGSLTVSEAIAAALESHVDVREPFSAILGMPAARESEARVMNRVDDLIDLVRLGAFRDKFVNELSTGSRRMVEIAALLGIGPRILLLDEPSSGIAQKEAEALGPILLDVQRELDASMLIIEHSMPLLTSIADHLVALDSGQFVTEGEPDDVLAHPHVVASYLGDSGRG